MCEREKKVVLIAEDEPKNMKLFRDLVEMLGLVALEANDGRTAVELAEKTLPDLILMDIQLPVMDGLAATRFLKASKDTRTIPIVALTASAMVGDRERALAAGCCVYLSKPINVKEFLATVAGCTAAEAKK